MSVEDILAKLVGFDTVKDSENEQIMNYIEELLTAKDFRTEYKTKCLVMSNQEECSLGFIGHTDTVQSGADWRYDPLKLTKEGNKLYGLGTCDMKGGIAAMLQAVINTDWSKIKKGMKLIFTYDEEIGFNGILEAVKAKITLPETMVIGEPTNNEMMKGSKGLLEFKITMMGKSAHSSNPSKGENAILKTMQFLEELTSFYYVLKKEEEPRFEIPYTTMNVGKIEGGKSINIVPNACTVYIDFRVISKKQRDQILDEINRLSKTYPIEYEIINDIKPFIAEGVAVKTTNFITEASFIDVPNRYILGVGPINPHEANEYITTESLELLVEQYQNLIANI